MGAFQSPYYPKYVTLEFSSQAFSCVCCLFVPAIIFCPGSSMFIYLQSFRETPSVCILFATLSNFWVGWNKGKTLASVLPGPSRQVKINTVLWEQGLFCFLQNQAPTLGTQAAIFKMLTEEEGGGRVRWNAIKLSSWVSVVMFVVLAFIWFL